MNTLSPIELLLQRMKQSKIEDARLDIKDKIDKQYNMLRTGNREVMLRTLHNSKTSSELSNISSKTQPIQYNNPLTKANKFKSTKKINPLTIPTTSDYLINPETEKIYKNPIVVKLEKSEKMKDKIEAVKSSDAYKKGKEMKKIELKMFKPTKTIRMGYDVGSVPGSSII